MAYPVPDDLWAVIEPLLPAAQPKPKGGRPRVPDRAVLAGILFVLRTGVQWREVPREFGCSGKTCWRRLCHWHTAGVWAALHRTLLKRLHGAGALDWSRAALDSASISAKKGVRPPALTPSIAAGPAPGATSSWTHAAPRSASC
jgi:transposase